MRYELEASYDQDPESPNDYEAFQVVSFSNRHDGYKHPETFMEKDCPACDGSGCLNRDYRQERRLRPKECPDCEGRGVVDCMIQEHPDVLAVLSYYEHGLCKWMVGESTVTDPGGWDTANLAGVIVYNEAEHDDMQWFLDQTPEVRGALLDFIAAQYSAWSNGECYRYTLSEISECGSCGQTERKYIDSCGGFIGDRHFSEYINSELLYGVDPANVTLTGEAEYAVTLQPAQVSV